MSASHGLGKGLDSLIPTELTADMPAAVRPPGEEVITLVAAASIKPNPHQPRTDFNAEELQGLADSIKQYGLLHPPVVSEVGSGTYELIAGERRVRAAKLAGMDKIPVIIRSFDEQQKLELALLENVQRSQLNPIETALAYRKLADEFNLTLDQIGARMGKAKSTVANSIRLLQLPPPALQAVTEGKISEAHGRAILALDDPARRAELLNAILTQKWSVRQAEAFVQRDKGKLPKPAATLPVASAPEPTIHNQTAQELADYLVTKVSIVPTPKGGKIVIEYYSDEELGRLVEAIHPLESE